MPERRAPRSAIEPQVPMKLRLLTYNVRSFRGGVEAAKRAVEDVPPDVALLQECGSRRAVGRFAASLGMETASTHRPFNRVRNAVAYSPALSLLGSEMRDLSRESGSMRRGFVAARLGGTGMRLTAVSVHLGLMPGERQRHARELTGLVAGLEGHVVVGVDLNESPEGPSARWIAQRLFDAFAVAGEGDGATFPAREPTARIDYLFVSEGVRPIRAWVPGGDVVEKASDHRPVMLEVDIA